MAKMKRLTKKQTEIIMKDKDVFPEYPMRCDFCTRVYMSQDEYIRHLEFHVRQYALRLQLIID